MLVEFADKKRMWPEWVSVTSSTEIKLAGKDNVRNFFEKLERLTKAFKTRAHSSKEQGDNLMTDVHKMFFAEWENYSTLLCGNGEPISQNDANGEDVYLPYHKDFRAAIAIALLKNKTARDANGLWVELFKHGDKELPK